MVFEDSEYLEVGSSHVIKGVKFLTNKPNDSGDVIPERETHRTEPDAARLGNPSFVWRFGQERRLALIERYVKLENLSLIHI